MDPNKDIEIWRQVWAAEASRDRWKYLALALLVLLLLAGIFNYWPVHIPGPDSHP